MRCIPTSSCRNAASLPIHFDERPIMNSGDCMLVALIGVEVAADVDNTIGESCQCILLNALTGAPVHLGQHSITVSDNHMLCAFSRDVVTSYSDDRTGDAGQHELMLALTGHPVHPVHLLLSGPYDGVLSSFN